MISSALSSTPHGDLHLAFSAASISHRWQIRVCSCVSVLAAVCERTVQRGVTRTTPAACHFAAAAISQQGPVDYSFFRFSAAGVSPHLSVPNAASASEAANSPGAASPAQTGVPLAAT